MSERIKKSVQIILGIVVLIGAGFFFWLYSGTATLTWNANTESDLAGYKIYYGATPRTGDCPKEGLGGYAKKVDVASSTQYIFKNLKKGETYYFSITSYDKAGNESCFSGELSKIIKY